MNILQTNIEKVTHIIHLADCHIRSTQRHQEYREVFSNLYKDIKNSNETTIVVFAGDLLHQKVEISPESLQLATEFIKNIANIRPFIIIAGNHDAILTNKNRLDSLTPIISSLNHPNVFYLKESGLYGFANILFNNMSVFDEPEKYILGKDIPSVYKNKYERIIGLFHGAVDQAISDTGHVLQNPNIMLPLFDNHNLILMGDIHKSQDLQQYDKQYDKPLVRYCGSTIQQNHGETNDKGYSLWDLETNTYTHNIIPNDYGFFTIEINHGDLVTNIDKLPKNVRLRTICKETIPSEVKSIISKLNEKSNIIETSYIRETSDIDTTNKQVSNINLKNIFNIEYQNKLITEYLKEIMPDISVTKLDSVLYINRNINSQIGTLDHTKTSKYRLIKLEWENMFSYGENNCINFENINGIYGILGKNKIGKSSIFEILLFTLFDKTSRVSKGNHIINNQKTSFKCKLELEIDGTRYFIERKGITGRTGAVKVDVYFWRMENDEKIELNGTERSDTNEIIRNYIGTFDDFILTSAYFQFGKNNLAFIDMGNSDRKDMLVKFIGIDVFDKLCNVASEIRKELNIELKIHKGKDYQTDLLQNENALEYANVLYSKLIDEIRGSKLELENLNKKIQEESSKLIKLDSDIPTNIGTLTSNKFTLEAYITQLTSEISILTNKSNRYERYIRMVENSISKIEKLDLIENHKKYKLVADKISAAKKKMDTKKIEIRGKLDKVEKLKNHKYDPNCKYCTDNSFVKDATSCKEQLKQDKIIAKELVDNLEKLEAEFENIKWVVSKYELYTKLLNKRGVLKDIFQTCSTAMLNKNNSLNKNKENLISINSKIEIYNRNLTSVENNNNINKILSTYKIDASSIEVIINKQNSKMTEVYGKSEVFKNTIANLKTTIENIKIKEAQLDDYEKYIEAIGRDGIPYRIICNAIPTIEKEVNDILTQITDFTLKLEDTGTDVIPYICYDDRKNVIETCSGYERFEMEFAIRIGLMMVSNLIRNDLMLIDEGMGVLDSEHLSSMNILFSILKTKFPTILVISHQDEIKDFIENTIEIKQVNGFSNVKHE